MKRLLFLIFLFASFVYPQASNFNGADAALNGVDSWVNLTNSTGTWGRASGVARAIAGTSTQGQVMWNQSFNKADLPFFGWIWSGIYNSNSKQFYIYFGNGNGNWMTDTLGLDIRFEGVAGTDWIQRGRRITPTTWENGSEAQVASDWEVGDTCWVRFIGVGDSIAIFKNSTYQFGFTDTRGFTNFRPILVMDTTTWRIDDWFVNSVGSPNPDLGTQTLVTPSNGATSVNFSHNHKWRQVDSATSYQFVLANNSGFTTTMWDTTVVDTSLDVDSLRLTTFSGSTTYYWKVIAKASGYNSTSSDTWSFVTRVAPATDWCSGAYAVIPPTISWMLADKTSGNLITPMISAYDSCGITRVRVDTGTIGGTFLKLDSIFYASKQKTIELSFEPFSYEYGTLSYIFTVWDDNGNIEKDTLTKAYVSKPALWSTAYFYKDGWSYDRGFNGYSLGGTAPDWHLKYIDFSALTHMIVFSAEVSSEAPYYFRESNPTLYMTQVMEDGVYKMRDSCAKYGVKYVICLTIMGSSVASMWDYMTGDSIRRRSFISYVAGKGGWMQQRGFTGIDIDQEMNSINTGNMLLWLREVRDTMRTWTTPFISMAGYLSPNAFIRNHINDGVDSLIDQYNIMLYNFANVGGSNGVSSALRNPADCNFTSWRWYGSQADASLTYWASLVSRNKIGALIAAESYRVSGRSTLCATGSGMVFTTLRECMLRKNQYPSGFNRTDVQSGRNPYLGFTESGTQWFYSWEDSISIYDKVKTVVDSGYGGIGIWDIAMSIVIEDANPISWQTAYGSIWENSSTAPITLPAPPTLYSPVNGATSIAVNTSLTWGSVSTATSYAVNLDTVNTFDSGDLQTIVVSNPLVGDIDSTWSNIANSQKYYWRVNAFNTTDTSSWSNTWSFTTVDSVVTPPAPEPVATDYQTGIYYVKEGNVWKSYFGMLQLSQAARDSSSLGNGSIIYNTTTGKTNIKEGGVWIQK